MDLDLHRMSGIILVHAEKIVTTWTIASSSSIACGLLSAH